MNKLLRCTCTNYRLSMSQIEAAQVLAYTHGSRYTGAVFLFCPWCGVKLKYIQEMTRKEVNTNE